MTRELKDISIKIGSAMTLSLLECRGTSTTYSHKGSGLDEVSQETKSHHHWRLRGVASKISAADVKSGDADLRDQEVYAVTIESQGFQYGFGGGGHRTRDGAIRQALEFAHRNGIEVDGYSYSPPKETKQ